MKKLAILVGAIALTGSTFAQKATTDAPFSLEGQLGFNASTLSFNAPTLRLRYFVADNIAVRLSLGMSTSKTVDNFYENEIDNTGGAGTYEVKNGNINDGWNLAVGGEYHFAGTDRLSPYAGLDVKFGGGKSVMTGDMSDGTTWIDQYTEETTASFFTLGLNLVGGADYYFAENFYVGMELGLGFNSRTDKVGEATTTLAGVSVTSSSNEAKSSSFGNNVVGNFRLGWRF